MHLSTGLFPASPEWERAIGARWIWDASHHPPYGTLHVDVARGHDITDGIDDFDIVDEGYSGLRLGEGSRVLASHELDGERHPLLWLRTVGTGSSWSTCSATTRPRTTARSIASCSAAQSGWAV